MLSAPLNCSLHLMRRVAKPAIILLDALFSPNHGGSHNCLQALRDASTSPSTLNSSITPLASIFRECSKAPPLPDRMHGFANVGCKPLLQTKGRNQPFWGTERRYSSHHSAETPAQQTPFASSQVTQQSPQQDIQSSTPPYLPIHTTTLLELVNNGSLEQLHEFGLELAQQQIPGRIQAHTMEIRRIASQLKGRTIELQQQQHHHHHHRNGYRNHIDAFCEVVEAAAGRKLAALQTFQHSLAPVLSRHTGTAPNAHEPELTAREQRLQQQLVAEGSGPRSVAAQLDVVEVCEALLDLKVEVDAEASRLPGGLHRCTELPGWWEDQERVCATDAVMDSHEAFTLSVRLLVSEFLSAWGHWQQRSGLRGPELGTADQKMKEAQRWSMAGPAGPPGYDPHAPPPPLINLGVPLLPLLALAAEDTRAFCIEKNSTAPEVKFLPAHLDLVACPEPKTGSAGVAQPQDTNNLQLQGQGQHGSSVPVILAAYVEHVFIEVLKNSMQALIAKWGAWDVDEADPILVEADTRRCSSSSSSDDSSRCSNPFFIIRITDTGGGIPSSKLFSLMHYFGTTHAPREASYHYSRDFGAQFQGQGVGAPLSRLYARFMGGHMQWMLVLEDGQELPLEDQVLTAGKISRELNSLAAAGHGSSCVAIVGTRVAIQLPCNGFSF
mmetsp:Transcript_8823/g.23746  ORF Transcript_8823/g.23746 Transcript_8823/m.23746 type:complete len:666 (+) Transcript_8823:90-2087(+)